MDNWMVATLGRQLAAAADPLVVDLGFGASAVTCVELWTRLRRVRADVRVVGLEIDPARVEAAQPAARPPELTFQRGGFEVAGLRPALVRAANVLRQYDEPAARAAWETMCAGLGPDGVVVEGTCDELGRLGGWVLLDAAGPRTLTLACRLASLDRPAQLAQRLPKALIHHNVPGTGIARFLADLDHAWSAAAPLSVYGPRQRWVAACRALTADWPVDVRRTRFGEITVDWPAVAPVA
jgi:hypothetical protein